MPQTCETILAIPRTFKTKYGPQGVSPFLEEVLEELGAFTQKTTPFHGHQNLSWGFIGVSGFLGKL